MAWWDLFLFISAQMPIVQPTIKTGRKWKVVEATDEAMKPKKFLGKVKLTAKG